MVSIVNGQHSETTWRLQTQCFNCVWEYNGLIKVPFDESHFCTALWWWWWWWWWWWGGGGGGGGGGGVDIVPAKTVHKIGVFTTGNLHKYLLGIIIPSSFKAHCPS